MATPTSQHYHEYRCTSCHKLLFKGLLVESEVEVKCKRCGNLNLFQGEPADKFTCLVYPCPHRIQVPREEPATTARS